MADFPTIIVSRRPRRLGSDWSSARSWLGGAPRLGSLPWPRGKSNKRPMYFLAQIALSEVTAAVGQSGLPSSGSLAFFVGMEEKWSQAVVFAPDSASVEPTVPPDDAFAAFIPGIYGDFPIDGDASGPRLFPYWPLDFTVLSVSPRTDKDEDEERLSSERLAEVDRHFTRRQYNFTAQEAFKTLGSAAHPTWWHTAIQYAVSLQAGLQSYPHRILLKQQSRDAAQRKVAGLRPAGAWATLRQFTAGNKNEELAKAEETLARAEVAVSDFERLLPEFRRYIDEAMNWTRDRDPWALMQPNEIERTTSLFARSKQQFADITRFHVPRDWQELATETLKTMATADDHIFAKLPEPIRNLINDKYLLSCGAYWHQMFGRPVSIQDRAAAMFEEGNILLLQLVFDDMMHWSFGDNGAFCFFISPDDLAGRNWGGVRLTFECG